MLEKVKYILKCKKGELYLDALISSIILIIVVLGIVTFMPLFAVKSKLDTFTNELVRTVEVYGRVDSEARQKEEDLIKKLGIRGVVSYSKTGKIQLNEEFEITVTYRYKIKLGKIFSYDFLLKSKGLGKGEVYWK